MELHMDYKVLLKCFTYLVLFMLMMIFSGCVMSTSTETVSSVPPVSKSIDGHSDIVLPSDLKLDSSKSMSITTDSFRGGIYHYKSGIELNSLKEFVKASMANNKWKMVGDASYKKVMLAFVKPNKTCMVSISDMDVNITNLTLYVTVDQLAAKGVNPFGEPED